MCKTWYQYIARTARAHTVERASAVQDEGDRQVTKRSSDPRVAVGIVASFAPRVSVFGKICLIEKPGEPDEGGRHLSKRSSSSRVAYPVVKFQVRNLVRVLSIVAPFVPRGSVFGENGGKWAQETCAMCPQQRYTTGEPGKFQGRDHVGILEGYCTGPAGPVFGGNSFYRETRVTSGVAMWLNVDLTSG